MSRANHNNVKVRSKQGEKRVSCGIGQYDSPLVRLCFEYTHPLHGLMQSSVAIRRVVMYDAMQKPFINVFKRRIDVYARADHTKDPPTVWGSTERIKDPGEVAALRVAGEKQKERDNG